MAMFAIAQALHVVQWMGTPGLDVSLLAQVDWTQISLAQTGFASTDLTTIHPQLSDWVVLAQQFDTDPFSEFREWFINLVETGQLWALLMGFVIGYLFRGLTSYG